MNTLEFCHQHNLVDPETAGAERRFGIRVTLPPADTLRKILGDDWERLHWYPTEEERDAAFENMRSGTATTANPIRRRRCSKRSCASAVARL